jgi:hypothetical protein
MWRRAGDQKKKDNSNQSHPADAFQHLPAKRIGGT